MKKQISIPFSRFDESFYDRLAEDTDYTGRQLWRVLRTIPYLETGRIRDVLNRIWLVPSTRIEGRIYLVNLAERTCSYEQGSVAGNCPDRKSPCVHIEAARAAERQFLQHNKRNVLIFPKRHWMPVASAQTRNEFVAPTGD